MGTGLLSEVHQSESPMRMSLTTSSPRRRSCFALESPKNDGTPRRPLPRECLAIGNEVIGKCKNGHDLLYMGPVDDGWACDGRHEERGCASGITDYFQTDGMERFECRICDYDLCQKCALRRTLDRMYGKVKDEGETPQVEPTKKRVSKMRTMHEVAKGKKKDKSSSLPPVPPAARSAAAASSRPRGPAVAAVPVAAPGAAHAAAGVNLDASVMVVPVPLPPAAASDAGGARRRSLSEKAAARASSVFGNFSRRWWRGGAPSQESGTS